MTDYLAGRRLAGPGYLWELPRTAHRGQSDPGRALGTLHAHALKSPPKIAQHDTQLLHTTLI